MVSSDLKYLGGMDQYALMKLFSSPCIADVSSLQYNQDNDTQVENEFFADCTETFRLFWLAYVGCHQIMWVRMESRNRENLMNFCYKDLE